MDSFSLCAKVKNYESYVFVFINSNFICIKLFSLPLSLCSKGEIGFGKGEGTVLFMKCDKYVYL